MALSSKVASADEKHLLFLNLKTKNMHMICGKQLIIVSLDLESNIIIITIMTGRDGQSQQFKQELNLWKELLHF